VSECATDLARFAIPRIVCDMERWTRGLKTSSGDRMGLCDVKSWVRSATEEIVRFNPNR
jgi:hypothetical protein